MQLASDNPHVKYAGTIFAACGIYPNVPQGVAWNGELRTFNHTTHSDELTLS